MVVIPGYCISYGQIQVNEAVLPRANLGAVRISFQSSITISEYSPN